MFRRTLIKSLAAAALLAVSSLGFALEAGKDYGVLQPPQPAAPNGQIEVLEFFSYGCPHCNAFDPKLSKWRAAQPKDVVFRRVPVSFGRPAWAQLARLHITLAALGLADKIDPLVFDAIHKQYLKLEDEKVRNDWLAKQGVDVKKFNDTWRSFGVESQVKRSEQMVESYKVQGVPMLVVDGRFVPLNTGTKGEEEGHDKLLENATGVVALARSQKAKK